MSTVVMRITVSAVHRDGVELFYYSEESELKLFLPITLDDAARLGEMLVKVRAVAAKVPE